MSSHVVPTLADLRRAERLENAAWGDLIARAPASFLSASGMRVYDVGNARAIVVEHFPPMSPRSNRIVGLGDPFTDEAGLAAALDAAWSKARRNPTGCVLVQVMPDASAPLLTRLLTTRGGRCIGHDVKAWRDDAAPLPVGVDLRLEVVGPHHADLFFDTLTTAGGGVPPPTYAPMFGSMIGAPDWTHWLAWEGNRPVATAGLFKQGDGGWLGMAATVPEYRGRGAQKALIAARVAHGRSQGCRWFCSETWHPTAGQSNPSMRNMERMGFDVSTLRANWVLDTLTGTPRT